MAKPIVIAGRGFPTKKAAEDACREILYGYAVGQPVSNSEHVDLLQALLMRHPHSDEKTGCGIVRFEVRQNPQFPSQRTLFLVRADGSETDFSFLKCITQPTQRHRVLDALRIAVAPQVIDVARRAFSSGNPVLCALTGQPLASFSEAHVDHGNPTFLQIAVNFASSQGGWEYIPLDRSDGMIGEELAHATQLRAWTQFHARCARLRVVSINANLSILRTGPNRAIVQEYETPPLF
ncbi:MAG: DCL family protein [Micromonosporaceae bacterium]|nr:DCL family protein [Micromonosporaceae bacterium]